ncbi:Uncharacterized protein Fot_28360 [Forsythia ovata]|uniref:Uncharacterized protein n=1 Tax=Forsythia ovata TaxID=205694 RepID=A0ABD1TNW3_9LAMI
MAKHAALDRIYVDLSAKVSSLSVEISCVGWCLIRSKRTMTSMRGGSNILSPSTTLFVYLLLKNLGIEYDLTNFNDTATSSVEWMLSELLKNPRVKGADDTNMLLSKSTLVWPKFCE